MRKTKEQIRKETLVLLYDQKKEEVLFKSGKIKKKLFSLSEFKKARFVMLYASRPEEVNTYAMIDEALGMGKRLVLPRCTSQQTIIPKEVHDRYEDLEKGIYGLYEPRKGTKDVKPDVLDLVVVPGIAFDEKNNRLGRGKGYYDRFLKDLPDNKPIIGLAFDFQILSNLPRDSHDKPVSKVITN